MKGFYVLRPSARTHQHVQHAVAAGAVDTVLYASDAPAEGEESKRPWLDGHEFGIDTLRRYLSFDAQVYPVVPWQDSMLSPSDPRNRASERISHALRIVREAGTDGVVWDTEDYRVQRGEGYQQPVPANLADRCAAAGLHVVGAMPKPIDDVWFSEDTYEKNRWWKVKWEGLGDDIIPGGWVEMHRDAAKYMRKLKKCYKGYWVYSHVRFGQRMIKPLWDHYVSGDQLPLSWWDTL